MRPVAHPVAAQVRIALLRAADEYETADFLLHDPSRVMHLPSDPRDREAAAFATAALSFGARSQFLPKAESILSAAGGKLHSWIESGAFERAFPVSGKCFYRFYTFASMHAFFARYRAILEKSGTLGDALRQAGVDTGFGAVRKICELFANPAARPSPVPADASSACKRICMFLRWMVRSGSPVDLGLWSDFIDRRTLVVPLDTHVLRQAALLGLLPPHAPGTMRTALRLTAALAEIFPSDPLRGDFALFGAGVDVDRQRTRKESGA